jgi:CHAT domain-containing protein
MKYPPRGFVFGQRRKKKELLSGELLRLDAATADLGAAKIRVVILLLVVFVLGFFGWRISFYQSDVDRGLAQLRAAYRGQRPTESRTTAGFEYASPVNLRGGNPVLTDQVAYEHAERLILDAAVNSGNARARHALGLLYLADGKTDEALRELQRAVELSPDDAAINSDLGAAYLEDAGRAFSRNDSPAGMMLLEKSLAALESTLKLAPNLVEAKFNRAICLERSMLQESAKSAWREFIDSDPTSGWADEARRHIDDINSRKAQNLKGDEVVSQFMALFREKDSANAALLIGNNRELIKSKYIPQALAFSITGRQTGERDIYLNGLQYAGEIEQNSIGDLFASELGRYYANASEKDVKINSTAQKLVQEGYSAALAGQYDRALGHFVKARGSFLKVGNVWEASLSGLMMAYCLTQLDRMKESIVLAEEITRFAKERSYRWLHSSVLFWCGAAQRAAGDRTREKANLQLSLDVAREIRDPSLTQLILMAYARKYSYTGLHSEALKSLREALVTGDASDASRRQRWRNYSDGSEILANARLFTLAKAVSSENDRLIGEDPNIGSAVYSKIDAAIVYSRSGALEEAEKWLVDARNAISPDEVETEKKYLFSKIALESGHLAVKRGDFARASGLYDEAFNYIETTETPRELYEIQKGRLVSYVYGDDDQKIEQQVVKTLEIAEKYRKDLPSLDDFSDTLERISFFDNQQVIYDIAVANNFKHGRAAEAYKYLEMSNSRALLNWLQKTVSVKSEFAELQGSFGAEPMGLDDIRARMPDQSQVLQYAVLDDRLLIWLFSRDDVFVTSVSVNKKDLEDKVTGYLGSLKTADSNGREASDAISRELYSLLIKPVAHRLKAGKQICIIPQKSLFRLPFAALLDNNSEPLMKSHELTYSPSANVFWLFSDVSRGKAKISDERLLAVGNPTFDKREFSNLPDLKDAEAEVKGIVPYYARPTVLTNDKATKDAFSKQMREAEVIHFAGHYIVRPGEPLNSGMLLAKAADDPTDGIMTNRELTHLQLPRAKLVVLAGCETGGEEYYNGEGVLGLSRTFLASGVPLVVASQWPVESSGAMKLMKKFHFYRRTEKLSTAAALRKAQLDLFAEPNGRFRSPYYWAAFAVFGGYAEF